MPERIEKRAKEAIVQKTFPGCVVGIIESGRKTVIPVGKQTYEAASQGVTADTMYDLASVTKSIPVASLALMLIAEGVMRLRDTARHYIPELRDEHGATIEDLLRYRVKGPRMSTIPYRTFEEVRTHVLERGFEAPPGDHAYANAPAFVLGVSIERATGSILPALAHERFFEPLQMRDTTFFPHDRDRCVPTEIQNGEEIRGIVHDESARIFSRARRAVGHAGLFSTVADLLAFAEALLDGRFPPIVNGAKRGLGWQANEPHWMGSLASPATFGKTGFTGTSIVVDDERKIAVVILSNRTYPIRPQDTEAISSFRRDIADLVVRA